MGYNKIHEKKINSDWLRKCSFQVIQCRRGLIRLFNLANYDSISSKVIRTQTEQFLELFSRTLNFIFLRLKDVKISLYIIVLIVRGCFDRTQNVTCRV